MLVGIYFSKPASGAALKAMASAGGPLANPFRQGESNSFFCFIFLQVESRAKLIAWPW
jgi:hypothetical protein